MPGLASIPTKCDPVDGLDELHQSSLKLTSILAQTLTDRPFFVAGENFHFFTVLIALSSKLRPSGCRTPMSVTLPV